jgi:NAD(P)-dependent dehydrogenase (short-subunit alcohol dehydrogenase family)
MKALITGGTTGIGYGIATAMLDAGYEVTVTGLTDEQVGAVPARQHLSAVKLDVTNPASVAAVLAPFDQLTALINCAGIIFRNGAEYNIETFQKVIDVNLTGTMRMCVEARPKLAAARGAIVNTASMLSLFGGPAIPAYTASKGGVAQLTKALAVACMRLKTGLPPFSTAPPCGAGANREILAGLQFFFVPKQRALSPARSCLSMAVTQQYEGETPP